MHDRAVVLVQRHTVQPTDPLETLDEDYTSAVIHLAWAEEQQEQQTLLFAFVELLPTEVPPPLDDGPQSLGLGPERPMVRLRRLVVPARSAVEWYLDCRRGEVALPGANGALRAVPSEAVDVVRGEDPPWPTLVCPLERAAIPFCPSWHGQPRVHRLVPQAAFPLDRLWSDAPSRHRATVWIEERLHFSLDEHPELWGSIHLVAPNPVYRAMGSRLYIDADARESVLVRFEPRAGKVVEGLRLGLAEGEPWGSLTLHHVEVRGPLVRFDVGRRIAGVKEEVYDPRRGVLETAGQYASFIRDIKVRMDARPASDSSTDPSIVRPHSDTSGRVVSTRDRMAEAYYGRKHREQTQAQYRVFEGRVDALEDLRERIGQAHRDVLIVDPHLRAVGALVDALGGPGVPLRFLTSPSTVTKTLLGEFEVLARAERRIELRVFGERAPLEGQYMVVDEQLWMFNVPLHRLGQPGTFIAKAPDDPSLRDQLVQAWRDARDPEPQVESHG